jgi:hypothetical protein
MDNIRRSLLDKYNIRINELKFCMRNDENMINGIASMGDNEYVRVQIEKANTKRDERLKEIKELEDKISKIPSGQLDSEIKNEINNNKKIHEEKERLREEKKKEDQKYKSEVGKKSLEFHKNSMASSRQSRYNEKDMIRGYNHFMKACTSIPPYIINNLKNMPGNKGYFWKNVACYGYLPREPGPTILFDKQYGGNLVIHEWTDSTYCVYHKMGKERKKLVSSELRRIRPSSVRIR